jgi:hypothetical protein
MSFPNVLPDINLSIKGLSMLQLNRASTNQTSAQSLSNIGNAGIKSSADKVFDICLAAQRNGADDLSGKEIQARYELLHGKRIDSGTVSARVNDLVTAKRLERLTFSRACTVSGRDIYPVRVPVSQVSLFY